MNFTDEALELWDRLSADEQREWISGLYCQQCKAEINPDMINVSIHEDQLALFHECPQCRNREVRLIDPALRSQKAIDDDFERWARAKRDARPDLFRK